MATLAQRTDAVEEKTDRLETVFAAFMERTDAYMVRTDERMERTERAIERLEGVIERMEQEGARDREAAARDREAAARDREEMKHEAAREREAAARHREDMKQEAARERKEMNERMGELSNRMGTIVEDIVAPSIRRLAREVLDCGDLQSFSTRTVRTHGEEPSREREFDALYVGTRAVLLNETKATARPEYARAFVEFLESGQFARYVPEYRELPVVPVFSSLSIPADVVTYLTRRGIYAVAMGDEAMQVLNLQAVRSRRE